jgi:hypothetical protein
MKRINALVALSIGVIASSSGMLQAQAATYNFFVNFSTKEVADYTAYNPTFNDDTYDLDKKITFNWLGTYRFDSCPTSFSINMFWEVLYRINGTGSFLPISSSELPDFPCSTTNQTYFAQQTTNLPNAAVQAIMIDDGNFVQFRSLMSFRSSIPGSGIKLNILGYRNYFELSYDFNTTYLFNYFLSDQAFVTDSYSGAWTLGGTKVRKLEYVFTTAGNDEYYIINTDTTDIGTTRKKYAVDYNNEFFRGESVGAQFSKSVSGTDSFIINSISNSSIVDIYNWYFLNTANVAQAIVNVPQISFTTQSCSGGFLDINVGCYVNNALAYLTNTAPIISDLTTIVNTGIQFAGQTFGVIGNFTTSNMFGYLILGGFGFITVKWLFKDDK